MKRKRVACFISVCIGAWLLIYGVWLICTSTHALVNFLGDEEVGEFVKFFYSTFLWIVMLLDYMRGVLIGILTIYPFFRLKSGKYIWGVACINLVCVFLMDVYYYNKGLGFTMIELNPKRLILPVILVFIGIWWQHYYRNNEKQLSRYFPYIGEAIKLMKK